jgi:hypothetical protein
VGSTGTPFERHPRAVDNFMREVGLDLQYYLPEMALSGPKESINTLEEEEDNDTEDTDEDRDIGQKNEIHNPQPHTNIHTETSSMTPFPARRSTRPRNPPVRLAYRAHADKSPNYTWIPPDLIVEMQHAYTTEVDNAMDINTSHRILILSYEHLRPTHSQHPKTGPLHAVPGQNNNISN